MCPIAEVRGIVAACSTRLNVTPGVSAVRRADLPVEVRCGAAYAGFRFHGKYRWRIPPGEHIGRIWAVWYNPRRGNARSPSSEPNPSVISLAAHVPDPGVRRPRHSCDGRERIPPPQAHLHSDLPHRRVRRPSGCSGRTVSACATRFSWFPRPPGGSQGRNWTVRTVSHGPPGQETACPARTCGLTVGSCQPSANRQPAVDTVSRAGLVAYTIEPSTVLSPHTSRHRVISAQGARPRIG